MTFGGNSVDCGQMEPNPSRCNSQSYYNFILGRILIKR